jgi:alkyl sulfatase BDS1-like metallo-beta-lactamase superfamily hydrolase
MSDNDAMGGFFGLDGPREFADGKCLAISSFGNVGAVNTGDGLVLIDTATKQLANLAFSALRDWSTEPVRAVILTHGHFDHAFGFGPILAEATQNGWERPTIIAHQNILHRFEKYRMLAPYQAWINGMQFSSILPGGRGTVVSPEDAPVPDILVKDGETYTFARGDCTFEVHPEWGETDDHLWVHVPETESIFAGDMLISSFPNVGNPFKVQRYPKQWADGLRRIADKHAEHAFPGHGPLVSGKERVEDMLLTTARALEFVHDSVVAKLNEHKWFDTIFREVMAEYPEDFRTSEWLKPIYGCPEFAIHASYRLYHGWFQTGNPTDLFPSPKNEIDQELVSLLGEDGPDKLVERAKALHDAGNHQLALHILDVALEGSDPSSPAIARASDIKMRALKALARSATSMITRNIYTNGANALRTEKKEKQASS